MSEDNKQSLFGLVEEKYKSFSGEYFRAKEEAIQANNAWYQEQVFGSPEEGDSSKRISNFAKIVFKLFEEEIVVPGNKYSSDCKNAEWQTDKPKRSIKIARKKVDSFALSIEFIISFEEYKSLVSLVETLQRLVEEYEQVYTSTYQKLLEVEGIS